MLRKLFKRLKDLFRRRQRYEWMRDDHPWGSATPGGKPMRLVSRVLPTMMVRSRPRREVWFVESRETVLGPYVNQQEAFYVATNKKLVVVRERKPRLRSGLS